MQLKYSQAQKRSKDIVKIVHVASVVQTYGAFPLYGTVRYGSVRVGCISTAV